MYKFFNILLSVIGLRYPISINTDTYFLKTPSEILRSRWRLGLYWTYSFLIFCCIMVEPIFLTILAIQERNVIYISNIAFLLIPPISQLIIINYFRSKSFDKIYYEVSLLRDTNHLIKNEIILSTLILVPSILSIIISAIFKFSTHNDNSLFSHFIDIDETRVVFLYIWQFMNWIYSRTITFLIFIIFFYVFFKHVNDIKTFSTVLDNHDIWSSDHTIVSEFIHAIIRLRYELNESVDKLSNVYICATILGAIGIGNVISNLKIDSFTLMSSVIFALGQLIFLYMIYLINKRQGVLDSIIMDPDFSVKYLYRRYRSIDSNLTNKSPVLYKNIRQFSEVQDLSVTSVGRLLKTFSEHRNTKVIPLGNLGDMVNDASPIAPPTHTNRGGKRKKKIKVINDIDEGYEDAEKASPLTKDIIKTINNIDNYNGSSIDFIILHTLISESWTTSFSLLGMQFDSSDSIQKALLITGTIATISGYLTQLQVAI